LLALGFLVLAPVRDVSFGGLLQLSAVFAVAAALARRHAIVVVGRAPSS
jgi:hypothetical protein